MVFYWVIIILLQESEVKKKKNVLTGLMLSQREQDRTEPPAALGVILVIANTYNAKNGVRVVYTHRLLLANTFEMVYSTQ